MKRTIVILGAGFCGMAVARRLSKLLPSSEACDIILVDQHSYSLFTPVLTEVAGGEVDADESTAAGRTLSPRVTFEQGRVARIDPSGPAVTIAIGDGLRGIPETEREIRADQLVIALGPDLALRLGN